MLPPLVSIITVNYNQTALTLALLQSLAAQDYRNIQVIVVDNGSTEDPGAVIAAQFPEVVYVRSAVNLGFAGGNNKGINHARGRYLFFVNNDTEVPDGCIGTLVDWAETHPDCGAVSPMIYYYPAHQKQIQYAGMTAVSPNTARNTTIGAGQTDTGQFDKPARTAYAHGAAMLVPRAVLEHVGPMYEQFFLYYEELDWCTRMSRAGFSIWINPHATIAHKESATVGSNSPLKTYFLHRNRMLFMQRNQPKGLVGFYTYILAVVLPKNTLRFALKNDWANVRAILMATVWYFTGIGNRYEKLVPPV